MRGTFECPATAEPSAEKNPDHAIEWCERRILQRIHRLPSARCGNRSNLSLPRSTSAGSSPGSTSPRTRNSAAKKESSKPFINSKASKLQPSNGNALSSPLASPTTTPAGSTISASPEPSAGAASPLIRHGPHPTAAAPRRVIPTNAAPITFYIRESADWLPHALAQQSVEESPLQQALSPEALQVRILLQRVEPASPTTSSASAGLSRPQTQQALWELATAGLAAADGFDQLRALHGSPPQTSSLPKPPASGRYPQLRRPLVSPLRSTPHPLNPPRSQHRPPTTIKPSNPPPACCSPATASSSATCSPASPTPPNGAISSTSSVASKTAARSAAAASSPASAASSTPFPRPSNPSAPHRTREQHSIITVAAADPMNLVGIVIPGDRVPAVPGKQVHYRNGHHHDSEAAAATLDPLSDLGPPPPPTSGPDLRLFQ